MKNTPENIRAWSKLYKDGIVDGDKVVSTENILSYPAGTEGTIRIRWEWSINSPNRAIVFNIGKSDEIAVCTDKFRKI